MSKPKAPKLPPPPVFQPDPTYTKGVDDLYGYGDQLSRLDLTGKLAPLAPTVSLDRDALDAELKGYFESLQPYYSGLRRNTINELAANNQLESSVTANRLAQIDTDLAANLQGKTSELVGNRMTQALENRIRLFGTGLNTLSTVTSYGQANQGQRNQFNLDNYQNQVEAALASQRASRGGLSGALSGAVGGALTGFMLGGPAGAIIGGGAGALYGGLSTAPGAGGQLMTAGAGVYGAGRSVLPGSSASNSPFAMPGYLDAGYRGSGYANHPDLYRSLYGGLN